MDAATKAMATELNRIRLDDDRSYASLAADIGVDPGALYKFLNEDDREPWDRTLHKIRRYLQGRSTTPSAKRPRKEKRARRVSLEA